MEAEKAADRSLFTPDEDIESVFPTLTNLVDQLAATSGKRKDIPIVFIPGFAGWGEPLFKYFNYFGGFFNTMQALVDDGWHVICPHLGPVSSNWERACEVYAQLTKIGKQTGYVDYGPSFENDPTNPYRTRRGRYTEGVMKNPDGFTTSGITGDWTWDANHPVHFVCHSQGGNTIRYLIHLLETGGVPGTYFEKPVEGAGKWVRSMTTLATPFNGTTVLDVVDNLGDTMYNLVRQVIMTAQHPNPEDRFFDLKLDHWGICRANPTEDYTAFCLRQAADNGPFTLWRKSEWHGFYDNSISGIAKRLSQIEPSKNVFYFTLATGATIDLSLTKGFEREYEHFLRGKSENKMLDDLKKMLEGGKVTQNIKWVQDELMGMIKYHTPKVMATANKAASMIGSKLPPSLKASLTKHAQTLSQKLPAGIVQGVGRGSSSSNKPPAGASTSANSASATGAGADTNPATAFTTTQSANTKLVPRLDILPLFALTAYTMAEYELKPHQRAEIIECYPAREAGFENSAAWWQNDGVVNTVSMAGPRNVPVVHWGGAVTGILPGVYTYLGVNETLDHADVLGISGNLPKAEKVVFTYRMIGRLLSHL